ncbi:MAG: invasion associated locus B family protein [Pseudomonadota bacterium]
MTPTTIRPLARLTWAALLALGFVAGQAVAQDATTDDTPAEVPAENQPTDGAATGEPTAEEILSTGTPVGQANQNGPEIYVREKHGEWEIRCLRAPEGQTDPCQMFKRLSDQAGNPTADVNIFDLPDGGEIVAGATILTPLQTLLTAQITMSVDGGQPRSYPFSFCDPSGCYARLGFTAEDVNRFRRGAEANLIVVPALAPDQKAELTMSLVGFTAGFEAIKVENPN